MKLHINWKLFPFMLLAIMQMDALPVSAKSQIYQKQIEEVIKIVNQERTAQGISPVSEKEALDEVANIRAQELLQDYNHLRPDGRGFYTALIDENIFYMYAAENIAWGQSSPEEVVNDWMTSTKGHRENILNVNMDAIGVGVAVKNNIIYWVQIFTGDSELPDLVYHMGDINHDGNINSIDASMLLKHVVEEGAGRPGTLSEKQIACADVNQSYEVNSSDAARILQYATYLGVAGTESLSIEEYYGI